jgi:hypothetical protein
MAKSSAAITLMLLGTGGALLGYHALRAPPAESFEQGLDSGAPIDGMRDDWGSDEASTTRPATQPVRSGTGLRSRGTHSWGGTSSTGGWRYYGSGPGSYSGASRQGSGPVHSAGTSRGGFGHSGHSASGGAASGGG